MTRKVKSRPTKKSDKGKKVIWKPTKKRPIRKKLYLT